jgi:hypothetical protein
MKPRITIVFLNGSSESFEFPSCLAAREFAHDGVSYLGGKIGEVFMLDEYGCRWDLWKQEWDAVSKAAGLRIEL